MTLSTKLPPESMSYFISITMNYTVFCTSPWPPILLVHPSFSFHLHSSFLLPIFQDVSRFLHPPLSLHHADLWKLAWNVLYPQTIFTLLLLLLLSPPLYLPLCMQVFLL